MCSTVSASPLTRSATGKPPGTTIDDLRAWSRGRSERTRPENLVAVLGGLPPADQLDDIVLAISEAVGNAVEHAYLDQPPGMVEVRGGIEATTDGQRRVTVIVRDHGRWRPAPADHENRRRGIPLMHACMDTVTIGRPDDDQVGTWVVLRSTAVSPPAL